MYDPNNYIEYAGKTGVGRPNIRQIVTKPVCFFFPVCDSNAIFTAELPPCLQPKALCNMQTRSTYSARTSFYTQSHTCTHTHRWAIIKTWHSAQCFLKGLVIKNPLKPFECRNRHVPTNVFILRTKVISLAQKITKIYTMKFNSF